MSLKEPVFDDGRQVSLTGYSNIILDDAGNTLDVENGGDKHSCEEKAFWKGTLPINRACILSYMFISWFSPMIWKVYRNRKEAIAVSDIWKISNEECVRKNTDRLKELWEIEVQNEGIENASLERVWKQFIKKRVATLFLMAVVISVAAFLSLAFLVQRVVAYLESEEDDIIYGICLTVAMALAELVRATTFASALVYGNQTGVRLRNAFMGLMYEKLLTLKTMDGKTNSEVIGTFSTDSYRVYMIGPSLVSLCLVPPFFILAIVYWFTLVQYWTFVAIATFVMCSFIQSYFIGLQRKFRESISLFAAKRVRRIREALSNMLFIKMSAWEKPFSETVKEVRTAEQKYVLMSAVVQCISSSIVPSTPTLASVITISAYYSAGNTLTASTVFAMVGTMNFLRIAVHSIPYSTKLLAEGMVSLNRLRSLLVLADFHPPESDCLDSSNCIELRKADFVWCKEPMETKQVLEESTTPRTGTEESPDTSTSFLNDINLEVRRGELIGICGSIGSGKSSLFSAIMGRISKTKGSLKVNGSLAYAAQQAWILNSSVKENILFGSTFDAKWFSQVVDACCLRPDIRSWQDGDETEIGERGINISGGQKQRLSIARAVYSNRDIYLLDDSLSAVDTKVGKRIFADCIRGLLGSKTVLFITHQLQYLRDCDQVVVMENGSISEHGHHDILVNSNGEYSKMINEYSCTTSSGSIKCDLNGISKEDTERTDEHLSSKERQMASSKTAILVNSEECAMGGIGWRTYTEYIKAGGTGIITVIVAFLFILSAATIIFADWWLSRWVDISINVNATIPMDSAQSLLNMSNSANSDLRQITVTNVSRSRLDSNMQDITTETFAIVYAAIVPFLILVQIVAGWAAAKVMISASNHLHLQCLNGVMRAPMSFFDATPVGRILNRFSTDMDETDVRLPRTLTMFLRNVCTLLFSIIVAALVSKWMIVLLLPAVVLFEVIRRLSMDSVRQIKRLENIVRSPLISHVNATSEGLSTIVAFGQEKRFIKRCEDCGDVVSLVTFLFHVSLRWAGLRLDLVSTMLTIGATLICILSKGVISPAVAGLVLGLCGKNVDTIQFLIRLINVTVARFTSVERLREYGMIYIPFLTAVIHTFEDCFSDLPTLQKFNVFSARAIPDGDMTGHGEDDICVIAKCNLNSEPDTYVRDACPQWPSKGAILFQDVTLRYRADREDVLRCVSFDIRPQEKVGIVGRTGAGKSSIATVLFRLVEITSGHVFIDGVDIADLSLVKLRSSLSTITQVPVMFLGTVRYNIDLFSKFTDDEVWLALTRVHMKEKVSSMNLGLDTMVEEGGENFSVGERQLICLARAVLRSCKILILDEATANVDTATDAKIQETIRMCFSQCTVITIAHRLNTVMHSDKIIVMDDGEVMECAAPHDLLANPHSFFNKMVAAQFEGTSSS